MNNNSIRSLDKYNAGIWPDKLFLGLLPRGITPTNVDAAYEINKHVLMFERKPHGFMLKIEPWGQIGALSALADNAGPACVFVQVCMKGPAEGDEPTSLLIHRLHRIAIPTTLEAIQALTQAWGEHADKCKQGRACMDLSWMPDSVRCLAAARVSPVVSAPAAKPNGKTGTQNEIPF